MSEFYLHKADGLVNNMVPFQKAIKDHPDGWIKIVTKSAKKRSNKLNRYLWGGVYPTALQGFRDIGYDEITEEEQVHEIFKNLFLKANFENHEGLVMEYTRHTKDLSNVEFIEYVEKIAKFCAENLHVTILMPNEQLTMPYEIKYTASQVKGHNAFLISK